MISKRRILQLRFDNVLQKLYRQHNECTNLIYRFDDRVGLGGMLDACVKGSWSCDKWFSWVNEVVKAAKERLDIIVKREERVMRLWDRVYGNN